MDRTGCPENLWLKATIYVVMLLNILAHKNLKWRPSTEVGLGYTPNASHFLVFNFFQKIFYMDPDHHGFPHSKEKPGRWLGPTQACGDVMTFWILTQDTNEIIARSTIRSVENTPVNLSNIFDEYVPDEMGSSYDLSSCFDLLSSSDEAELPLDEKGRFASLKNVISKARKKKTGVNIDPSDLLGYSFVHERDDGIKQRATVVEINNQYNLFTLEYITGDRDLIDYNQLINSFNAVMAS